jgi:hypothetical protein
VQINTVIIEARSIIPTGDGAGETGTSSLMDDATTTDATTTA